MVTNPHSLYGRAILIRLLLRGSGPAVAGDGYSLRLIADAILSQSAAVRQNELLEAEVRGTAPDASQMVTVKLTLGPYKGIAVADEVPVTLKQADLPTALTWKGRSAIFGLTTRPELPGWPVKETSAEAIRTAIRSPYLPARPAGWPESDALAVALPLTWSGIGELYARYIPSAINIGPDGNLLDVEQGVLSLTDAQWAKIERLVLAALNPMIQTTTNKDTHNDGHDDSTR